MLVGSSETAVMWGTSEPEGGTQRRVRLKGAHQGEQEAGICRMRSRRMPGWPTPRGQGSQGHTGRGLQALWVAAKSLDSSLLGKKIQGGVHVGEESNQGPFPMESWGSQLGNLISL